MDYLMSNPVGNVDVKAFESACGVGIVVTPEQIEQQVEKLIEAHSSEIREKRYRFNVGLLMGEIRNSLKWADGKVVKSEIDIQLLSLLGPKTEADLAPPAKVEKASKPAAAAAAKDKVANKSKEAEEAGDADSGAATISELMKNKVHFHKPGDNFKTDGYVITDKTMDLLKDHLKLTGGQVG